MSVAAIMENYRPELRAQILGGEDSYTDPKKLQFLLHWINGIYFLHFLGVQNRRPGLKKAKNSMHQLVQDFLPSTVVHEQGATFFVCIFSWFLDTPVKKKRNDLMKAFGWFQSYDPFQPKKTHLNHQQVLSSGMFVLVRVCIYNPVMR